MVSAGTALDTLCPMTLPFFIAACLLPAFGLSLVLTWGMRRIARMSQRIRLRRKAVIL